MPGGKVKYNDLSEYQKRNAWATFIQWWLH